MHGQQLPPHAAAAAAAHGQLPMMPHPLAGMPPMPPMPPGAAAVSAAGLLTLGGPPGHIPSVAAAMASASSAAAASAGLKDPRSNDNDAASSKRSNSGK